MRTRTVFIRASAFLIALLSVFILPSGCSKDAEDPDDIIPNYSSYMDIPGVTQEEITAIKDLRKQKDSFTYSVLESTEAFYNENHEIRGFSVLFCEWLSDLFGIKFKPVFVGWNEYLSMLEGLEVDFTGHMTPTEERLKTNFMTTTIAHQKVRFYRIEGTEALETIAKSRRLKCAFIENTTTISEVTSQLEDNTYDVIIVPDTDAAYQLLSSGEADAFFNSNMAEAAFDYYPDIVAKDFFPLIYSPIALATQNPAFIPIISIVQKALDNGAMHHLTVLYNQGEQEYLKSKLFKQFTETELAYIRENPVIPVGMDPGNYPGCFYDKHEKEWRGIFIDLTNEISVLTGLEFRRVNNQHTEWPAIYNMLVNGDIAIVPELAQTKERIGQFIWPDSVQMTDYYALISKSDFRDIKINEIVYYKIGIAKNVYYTDIFNRWFPGHQHTYEYLTMEDAFDALHRGDIDMVMATQKRLLYLTHYMELPGYKANVIFDQPLQIKFGFNKDQETLCSIINKTLKLVDMKSISEHWVRKTYDYQRKMAETQIPWLIGSTILFFSVLALVIVLFIKSSRTGKELEKIVAKRTYDLNLQTSMLMTVFNSSPDFIFCKDMDFHYIRCNKSLENFLQITAESMIGKNDAEIFRASPETANEFSQEDKSVISKKGPEVYENIIISPNGSLMLMETIKTPLMHEGKVTGVMGISRDITKRKTTETQLALQTAKLQTILDSIPDIVYCKDLNYKFTQCNKVVEEYTGVSEKDAIGKNEMEAFGFSPELQKHITEVDRATINEDRIYVTEETMVLNDGVTRILETVKTPLKQDGMTTGLLAIARDVTKRKEMEEAALSASRSKSEFLANMSHEIRTPMNSIIGFSELAMDDTIPPRTREYLQKILENAEGLLQITNNVLDISKVEAGRIEMETIPFDLHELFSSCRSIIMPKAVEKGLILYFYAEPSAGKMPLGDPTRLRQVLLNLLSNAVKFTNTGTIKVHSVIRKRTDSTITMHFEVKDSGIGMTPDQIKKIFEPFTQAETGTTRKFGGTGLGLSIAKNLVELMGGELTVESAPGIGSKFFFDITFNTIDVAEGNDHDKKVILNEIKKPTFDGEILLCEDNIMNQEVICEHLSRVGIKTVVAENGKAGVDIVRERIESAKKPFDLIFMDIHMPVMDGLEASEKIMAMQTETPIIAMTANIMTSDREIYKKSGMADYISKPFTSQELWRCLMNYFEPRNWQTLNNDKLEQTEDKFRQKMIKTFVSENKNKYEEIYKALDDGDIKLAHRLAHALKSNAGQLGKTLLQHAAEEIETSLENGENLVTEEQLKTLETELNMVLLMFSSTPSEISEPESPQEEAEQEPPDTESARDLLEKLEPMLEMGNPGCREFIDELGKIPGSGDLIKKIDNLDFDEAIIALQSLKEADLGK